MVAGTALPPPFAVPPSGRPPAEADGSAPAEAWGSVWPRLTAPARWRIVPALDQDPRAVAAIQSERGRIVLLAAVTMLAVALGGFDVDLRAAPVATLCAYARTYRRHLVALATLLFLCRHAFWIDTALIRDIVHQEGLADRIDMGLLLPGVLATVVLAVTGLLTLWPRLAGGALARFPTTVLIAAVFGLAIAAQSPVAAGLPRVLLWSLLLAFQPYLWFLAYALADRHMLTDRPLWQHLGVFHPFWGSSMTPFGKGLSYLDRYEAKTAADLAVTQLKGLKLACWTLILAASLRAFGLTVHGMLGVPRFERVFLGFVDGVPEPRSLCWAGLAAFFVEDVLTMTVWGGAIVSCARLAGFRLLRNTYRPLEARTLAEFWNRYYFFYKELLVDHFFYPTFFRWFRKNKTLRVFFATFMAACVGNLLFHFIRDIRFVAQLGWWQAVSGDASHAFYTLLLALGVGISQARGQSRERTGGWLRGRLLPCLWVVLFFCVLHVFDAPTDRIHTIGQRLHFLSYLFGVESWT